MVEHELTSCGLEGRVGGEHKRVPYGVWIEEGDGIPSFYLAHGLSHDGLMLRAKHPPRAGLAMSMRLIVENEQRVMSVQGEVVYTDSGNSSFAVRFVDLDDDELAFLEDLIEETVEA